MRETYGKGGLKMETTQANAGYPKFRWFVLITMLIATIGNGVTLIALSPNVADVAATLGVDLGVTSAATMVSFNLAMGISGIFCGRLIDRFGTGKVWTVAFLINIVATLLYIPIGGVMGGLLVIRIIQGAVMVTIMGAAPSIAAIWFPAKERGIVTGVQAAAIALGVAVGLMISPRFTVMTGHWQKGAAMCVIVSIIAFIFSLIVATQKQPHVAEEGVYDEVSLEDAGKLYRSVWKHPLAYICTIVAFLFGWSFNVFNDLIPGYAAVDYPVGAGYGPVVAGNMLSLGQVGFMIGALLAGLVIIRLAKGKVAIPLCVLLVIGGIAVYLLNPRSITGTYAIMQVVVIIAGFCIGSVNPLNMGFVANNYHPAVCGRLGAFMTALMTFGGVIGLSVSSAALSATGYYKVTIMVVGTVCIIAAILALFIRIGKKTNIPGVHTGIEAGSE